MPDARSGVSDTMLSRRAPFAPVVRLIAVAIAVAMAVGGCTNGVPYADPVGPRAAASIGDASRAPRALRSGDTITVVSFNIEYAREVDRAIRILKEEPELRAADVVLLQEMTADATERIAGALGMSYLYYPALYNFRQRRDVGNAILSRWPMAEESKLLLPHPSRYAGTGRTATGATLIAGTVRLRVYSAHLGTIADVSSRDRAAQLSAILDHAGDAPLVIVGGDMNARAVGSTAVKRGFAWLTEGNGRTTRYARLDHVFVRGFGLPEERAAGVVQPRVRASDHRPVWARMVVP